MKIKTSNDGNGSMPRHIDEADLISYLDGELDRSEQDAARVHLEGCWNCRSRVLSVQNSIEKFLRVRKEILPDDIPPTNISTAQFRRRLAEHQKAPASFRLQMPPSLQNLRTRSNAALAPIFRPVVSYQKTAFATAVVLIVVTVLLLDPLKWNSVSADQLMLRASNYEISNETSSGKVIRTRTRIDRINVTTRSEKYLGQIETDADNVTRGLHVAVQAASGASEAVSVSNRDQATNVAVFAGDFNPETAKYFSAQGWLPQVSFSSYQRLIRGRGFRDNDGASVARHGAIYEVRHPFAAAHPSRITEAVLTLNAQTYAPQAISIFTIEGTDRFEYRLTRTAIDLIERTPEVAKLFETPTDTNSGKPRSLNELEARTSKPEDSPELETRNSKPETSLAASADLEVEVLRLLHEAGADLGEQVTVQRGAGGPVRVNGIVDTDQRRNEIIRALQPVANNSAVKIEVKTVAEALSERRDQKNSARVTTVEGVEVAVDTFPAYQDLRARMSDEDARVFAARMVSRSHSAMRHAWALKRLMSQFSTGELKTLQPEAHAKWIALIQSHARDFAQENAVLRQQLQPMFGSGAESTGSLEQIENDADLTRAVERLVGLATANYEVVRSAFTVTREATQFTAIKSPQFWQSMKNAESVAQSIEHAH